MDRFHLKKVTILFALLLLALLLFLLSHASFSPDNFRSNSHHGRFWQKAKARVFNEKRNFLRRSLEGTASKRNSLTEAIEEESSPSQQLKKAEQLFREEKYSEAIFILRQILTSHKDHHDARSLMGWCYYRLGDFKTSESLFKKLLKDFPESLDAMTGLAYSKYQNGKLRKSEELFHKILEESPEHADAIKGIGLVKKRQGNFMEAREWFQRARAIDPEDRDIQKLYEQSHLATMKNRDRRRRGPLSTAMPLKIRAKAGTDYLSVKMNGKWKEIFIKGVNLGVALPGKFPAEFPMDKDLYLDWLDKIAAMNANTVRIYTLLPPSFYQALKEHNAKKGVNRLWLIQGVWVELPPEDDFYNAEFMEEFQSEIARVIDAIHGNIDIGFRPGHAYGRYRDDVSAYLLAIILGREWEPFSILRFKERYPQHHRYEGTYFRVEQGNPMECWIAEICNFAAEYERGMYREQHPLSFSNWPTLDPLSHPTETSKIEENEIKKRLGLKVDPIVEDVYDDDAVTVDAMHIIPTHKMEAGFFASYHIYPYHPDFLNLDPFYSQAKDSEGPNNYIGYLKDLKRHHHHQPLLVAEFGVPTSRGVSHFQPQGMNHGGHTEREQGEICRRLMNNIREAKCAGGIVFSWIDEWFKKNWLTVDFENPLERNPLWYNAMDPEQNYGLLAMKPGEGGWKITIDGKDEDWEGIAPLYHDPFMGKARVALSQTRPREIQGSLAIENRFSDGFDGARDLKMFQVTSDEGYLYLKMEVLSLDCDKDGEVDWDKANYFIGIDTYRRDLGDFKFPPPADQLVPSGMEFMIQLKGYDHSKILVDDPYDTFIHTAEGWGPYQSLPNRNGKYKEIKVETNRERYGRNGDLFPAISYSKSPLKYGSMEKSSDDYNTLCDWYLSIDKNFIEMRIPWAMLHVTDPSSRRVLHQTRPHRSPLDTVETEGFVFYVISINPEKRAMADSFPFLKSMPEGKTSSLPIYRWEKWEYPSYHSYLKDSYFILKDDFLNIRTYIIR